MISEHGWGATINHTVTNSEDRELTVGSLCSDLVLYSWRPQSITELNEAIEDSLLDDIHSSNCRVRRDTVEVVNAALFLISCGHREMEDVVAKKGSADELARLLEL